MGVCGEARELKNIEFEKRIKEGGNLNMKLIKILNNIDNSICKIILDDGEGSGFFTKIKIKNDYIYCLMTNYHVINEETLLKECIHIVINNKLKKIILNKRKWKNKYIDYTCIEIGKDLDIIILEIDESCYNNNYKYEDYNKKEILIASLNDKNKIEIPLGKIINNEGKNEFLHDCNTEYGFSGSPILLIENSKIIGVHCGYNKTKNKNIGIYMKDIINDISQNYIAPIIFNKINDINKKNNINKNIDLIQTNIINKLINNNLNKYDILEGILVIKNDFLFLSKDNLEIELFINNQKISIFKNQYKYKFDFNENTNKCHFKIIFKNKCKQLLFYDCINLYSIDFTNFDFSMLTDINSMFHGCENVIEVKGINCFNSPKIIDMKHMFCKCVNIKYIDLNIDTSNTIDMSFMFNECFKLKTIKGINKFITNKVINMESMFQNCRNLENLNLNFDTINVTNMKFMFNECHSLKNIEGIKKFNTKNVVNMNGMFQACYKLEFLNLNFKTSNITDMSYLFNKCKNLKKIIGINKFETNKVTNMCALFNECQKLEYLDLNFDTSNVIDMGFMFGGLNLINIIYGIELFNTKKVENMRSMFQKCYKLKYLDLNFDTSNVNDMDSMFNKCYELQKIKGINKFNTNKVMKLGAMFQQCYKLEYLDLNFNTSNVIDMECLFNKCINLKEIKGLNNFNTIHVISMKAMFQDCYELEYLNLNFDTSNVTDLEWMFAGCKKLRIIRGIDKFKINKFCNKKSMFFKCLNLKH